MTWPETNVCVFCFCRVGGGVNVPPNTVNNILNKCSAHLHSTVNNDSSIGRLLADKTQVKFCKQCLDFALELAELSDQLGVLQRTILDLSVTFSLEIFCRRNQSDWEHAKEENDPPSTSASLNSKQYETERYECVEVTESEEDICNFIITNPRSINDQGEGDFQYIPENDCGDILEDAPIRNEFDQLVAASENCPEDDAGPPTTTQTEMDYIILNPILTPRIMIQRLDTMPNLQQFEVTEQTCEIKSEHLNGNQPNARCAVQGGPTSSKAHTPSPTEKEITITATQDVAARLGLAGPNDNNNSPNIKIKVFKCGDCHRVFGRKDKLEIHKKIHTSERPHLCSFCNKSFLTEWQLQVHGRIHTGEKPFNCSVCNKAFNQLTMLNNHKRTHTGEKPYKCPHCNWAFTQPSGLSAHLTVHTGEKPFKCSYCEESFKSPSVKSRHQRNCQAEKSSVLHNTPLSKPITYPPSKINASISTKVTAAHLQAQDRNPTEDMPLGETEKIADNSNDPNNKNHTVDKPYKCGICDRGFDKQIRLNDHARIHTGEKPFKCLYCEETFARSDSRSKHHRMKHKRKRIVLRQSQILKRTNLNKLTSKSNTSFNAVGSHLQVPENQERIQTGEKPVREKTFILSTNSSNKSKNHTLKKSFKCSYCNKGFGTKAHMREHETIHTGETPFKCFYCEKLFRTSSYRSKHVKSFHIRGSKSIIRKTQIPRQTHPDQRLYKYNMPLNAGSSLKVQGGTPTRDQLLSKKSIGKAALSSVKKVNMADKPFKCTHCSMAFTYLRFLTVHERVHTGEKPFKCEICNLTFARSSAVKVHSRVHTGEKPFKCLYCEQTFRFASGKYRHQNKVHFDQKLNTK